MYNKFFGFKEKPFKLVPNPEYLFLSKSHEEALAHLSYAISHGDGFVEITGEVGTGKTTLCRVFLDNLDPSIEAAYIFNPKLDALQLLKAINDEFGIDSTPDNTKDLIDRLNTFLIEKRRAGKKVLVLIDEAQNLSLEVLEQLRLLSNLETTQEKLLQIILVGQPELGAMLSSHQLRQLGQRITINCRLLPLTFHETKDYIRHRITLASHRAGPPFDKASYRAIFAYSGGIPRLINIACDRTLLNAFSRNSFKVTGAITKEAIYELSHHNAKISPWQQAPVFIVVAVLAIPVIAALFYFNGGSNSIGSAPNKTYSLPAAPRISMPFRTSATEMQAEPLIRRDPALQPAATPLSESDLGPKNHDDQSAGKTAALAQSGSNQTDEFSPEMHVIPPSAEISLASAYVMTNAADLHDTAEQFLRYLQGLNSRHSRNTAILQAVKLWSQSAAIDKQLTIIDSDQVFFRKTAAANDLLVQPLATDTDLNIVQALNLPAILTFYPPNHTWPKYITLAGLDAANAYLDAGDQGGIIPVARKILRRYWSGEAYIVWKNFIDLDGIIAEGSGADTVKALKTLLRDLSFTGDVSSGKYDAATSQFIKDLQRKKGLEIDGIVGPFTKIALYNERQDFIKPALDAFTAIRTENGS